jgi:hypothetical protein
LPDLPAQAGCTVIRMRKLISVLLKIVGGIVALAVALVVGFVLLLYNDDVEMHRFSELEAPDGKHALLIHLGNPSLPMGSHLVRIAINSVAGEPVMEGDFRLANDGANITSDNIHADWIDHDSAEVCLRGEEQSDTLVSVELASRRMTEKNGKC